ncbi:hypothetical protein H7849_16680 [Alloacidobacterium dinghuense]|uniref:Cytochrome c domain-containing protein n=1 Tax=Alloacidobacterium dinghuense TaxID=2763107 RepID=A0A7G8BDX7_9BACT|nr:hypothetical protein [Alloacidobacterium dinghuense]QNI30747.1 hypothetical protein H7849_16680 [Alloacidobacterium dinghuense]
MKRYLICLSLLVLFLLGGMGAVALQQDPPPVQTNQKSASSVSNTNAHGESPTGEEVFQANCARCHRPPMSISPRTTGTIIMHMRARARLSRQDEQLLLKYLAP